MNSKTSHGVLYHIVYGFFIILFNQPQLIIWCVAGGVKMGHLLFNLQSSLDRNRLNNSGQETNNLLISISVIKEGESITCILSLYIYKLRLYSDRQGRQEIVIYAIHVCTRSPPL